MKTGKDGISDIISVFNMYEQKMYHIAYAILHDSYQAEDAVMDAFVRLLERQYSIEDPAANATKRLIIQVTRPARQPLTCIEKTAGKQSGRLWWMTLPRCGLPGRRMRSRSRRVI